MRSKLRQIREERGWSQITLAAYTLIAQGDLSKIERGQLAAGPERRRRIAQALRVSEDELFPPDQTDSVRAAR